MALASPGSEWANVPTSPEHRSLAAPPPATSAAPLDASQSTDRSYRSLISSALDVINELRERGFASETFESSRSGGASKESWREDDYVQTSALGTPYSPGSQHWQPTPRMHTTVHSDYSAELPSSSTKIHAFNFNPTERPLVSPPPRFDVKHGATLAPAPHAQPATSPTDLQRLSSSSVPFSTARPPAATWDPSSSSGNRFVSAVSPTSADDAKEYGVTQRLPELRGSVALTLSGGLSMDASAPGTGPGGQRVPLGSPPFVYSPDAGGHVESGRSGSWGAQTQVLGSSKAQAEQPRTQTPTSTGSRASRRQAGTPPELGLNPPTLQSSGAAQLHASPSSTGGAPATLDPAAALIEDAVNEWLDGVAPRYPPSPTHPQALGRGTVADRDSPRAHGSGAVEDPMALKAGTVNHSRSAGALPRIASVSPRSVAPSPPRAPANGISTTAEQRIGQEYGSSPVPDVTGESAFELRQLVKRIGNKPEGVSGTSLPSNEIWRLQRTVEAAYHALVRARRARELVVGRNADRGAPDPSLLPLSAPGATVGGRFSVEPWPPARAAQGPLRVSAATHSGSLAVSASDSSSESQNAQSNAVLLDLCAELGVHPTEARTQLVPTLHALGRVAMTADTLDRFAERVCSALGGGLVGLKSSAGSRIGLEQAVLLLDAMLGELLALRRLRASAQTDTGPASQKS